MAITDPGGISTDFDSAINKMAATLNSALEAQAKMTEIQVAHKTLSKNLQIAGDGARDSMTSGKLQ